MLTDFQNSFTDRLTSKFVVISHSFTFNSRLKAHAVEYNGKNTLTVKIDSGIEIEHWSWDHDHAPFVGGLSSIT